MDCIRIVLPGILTGRDVLNVFETIDIPSEQFVLRGKYILSVKTLQGLAASRSCNSRSETVTVDTPYWIEDRGFV